MRLTAETLSTREIQEREYEKQAWEAQAEHQLRLKDKEIEVMKLEAKWASWIKIPVIIITLPVRILFVIPLSIYAATKQEVPEFYQRFFK